VAAKLSSLPLVRHDLQHRPGADDAVKWTTKGITEVSLGRLLILELMHTHTAAFVDSIDPNGALDAVAVCCWSSFIYVHHQCKGFIVSLVCLAREQICSLSKSSHR